MVFTIGCATVGISTSACRTTRASLPVTAFAGIGTALARCYPEATSILWLCDGGGSNAASKYIFKHDLQQLADQIGVEIRVAHYPSYCSKYNLIERRLFPHITRACQGMLFDTLDTVVTFMRKASTSTGLRTTVNVMRRYYETGRKATARMKQNLRIVFDNLLPKWNYRAIPQDATVIN